jgi:hypothetical protein
VWVTAWLLFVLAILVWVVARQTSAVVAAAELDSLRNERSLLEARRAQLLRRIRSAESRAVLIPHAESLGLRLPADSEIVILSAPEGEDR